MFTQLVREHFKFLVDDYGMSIVSDDGGIVVYSSTHARVVVVANQRELEVDLGPFSVSEVKKTTVPLDQIIYVKDSEAFHKEYSETHDYWTAEDGEAPEQYFDRVLRHLAQLVKLHCDDELRGDWSILVRLGHR